MRSITLFFAALLGLASWLAPNHYPPWLAFHSELLMGGAGMLALAGELVDNQDRHYQVPLLTITTLLVACVPLIQALTGMIHFTGDAWMAFAYLLAFALAQVLGQSLVRRWGSSVLLERLAGLLVAASIACVGLQLYQWLGLTGLGIFAAELPPRGQPFANVAQPNHLATMLFLGLVGMLVLYERRGISDGVAAGGCLFLEFGLVMTASRTAWLAMLMLVLWLGFAGRRATLRMSISAALGLGAGFLILLLSWAPLNDFLLLSSGRSFESQAQAGPRPLLWATMLDAISRQPWLGYGWNQGLVAQSRVVDMHPAAGRLIENSHNLLLDLMVWNGVPLALALTAALAWWFWRHIRASHDAAQVYLLAAIGGVFVHAMVEYPLSYFYFLLPVGIMMGALDATVPMPGALQLPRWTLVTLASASAMLLFVIVYEYSEIESSTRVLRFETARIGAAKVESKAPDLVLLTQWREYLRLARVEPHPGMTSEELAWMNNVVERFPYAAAELQLALANGLNGHRDIASEVLARLCHLHSARNCAEQVRAWQELTKSTYPQLADVPVPFVP